MTGEWVAYTARHVASIPDASCRLLRQVQFRCVEPIRLKYTGTVKPRATQCHTDGGPYNFCLYAIETRTRPVRCTCNYWHRWYKTCFPQHSVTIYVTIKHPPTHKRARAPYFTINRTVQHYLRYKPQSIYITIEYTNVLFC